MLCFTIRSKIMPEGSIVLYFQMRIFFWSFRMSTWRDLNLKDFGILGCPEAPGQRSLPLFSPAEVKMVWIEAWIEVWIEVWIEE